MNAVTIRRRRKKLLKKLIILGAVFLVLIIFGILLINTGLGLVKDSRLETLNGYARIIWSEVDDYQSDSGVVTGLNDSDRDRFYWAAVYENGELLFTLSSKNTITEDELVIPDKEKQRALLSNIFTQYDALGCYCGANE